MTPPADPAAALGFTPAWFAAGVVTPESAADFARYAAANPGRPARSWRWAAFRDFVEERGPLSAEGCRLAYRLGEAEPDANLGTAILCAAVYQPACPADVLAEAAASDRPAVRRAARLGRCREPSGTATQFGVPPSCTGA